MDSPLEETVSSERVSEAEFPASTEFTGNFIDSGLRGASTTAIDRIKSSPYEPIITGNFLEPCREFKSAIREISVPISESALVAIWADESDPPARSQTTKRMPPDARSADDPRYLGIARRARDATLAIRAELA